MRPYFFLVLLCFLLSVPAARAEIVIDVTRGSAQPLPIAIPDFAGLSPMDEQLGREVAGVVEGDLRRSGLFAPIDRAAFIEKVSVDAAPQFESWRVLNAQGLVTGRIGRQPDGQIKAEFRLWDVFAGQQLAGQQVVTAADNWRRIAHLISDQVYERLTGEKGYFDSRIVFIDESGPKTKRVKRLAIMDQDGANVRYLSDGRELVVTPRFSPVAQKVVYMAHRGEEPRVYLLDLATGRRQVVGNFSGMTFSPRFSPDGQRVIMSLQQGGDANIYTKDLRGGQPARITATLAIDTAPSFSPDGQQIVFESDRGGQQQLYVMDMSGSDQRRISLGEGTYSTPVWSPRGDMIAFTKQAGGQFMIGVMKPDGSDERILTQGFHNEGPTWSPNGRVVMFFRDSGGANGGPQLWSVDLSGRNEQRIPTPGFASDPAWSPLLQ